jgi:hypothetical protein
MPLRRAGTVTNTAFYYGPGSAAHHAVKNGALRGVRGTMLNLAAWPKLRISEGWRPGLDLNQDKEQCTAPASTLSATGPHPSWANIPQGATFTFD